MNQSQPKNPQRMAILLIAAGGVILIVAALTFIFQGNAAETAAQPSANEDLPYPQVGRISVEAAWASMNSGTAIILDVRGEGNHQAAHIPGAISIPTADIQLRMGELSKESEILTYCT
jgi:hypothetical protein